jgi:hypothetical protein
MLILDFGRGLALAPSCASCGCKITGLDPGSRPPRQCFHACLAKAMGIRQPSGNLNLV